MNNSSSIPRRGLGQTGLSVSVLGLGTGPLGEPGRDESSIAKFLNEALDLGVTLIDAARSYGAAEERVGKFISSRRNDFVLSTKVGYGIAGHDDWTYGCVAAGVDAALRRLRTDWIDIVHLHSCPLEVLNRGDVIRALEDARCTGKIRVAAYSGENEALRFAAMTGHFQALQASVNLCDQRGAAEILEPASRGGLGIIAKRALANAPWRDHLPANDEAAREYRRRWDAMGLAGKKLGVSWDEAALRFAAYRPGIHACLVGTASLEHLRRNAAALEKGPLEPALEAALRDAFGACDRGWRGQI